MKIRKAIISDLPALVNIYNQAIRGGQTADTNPISLEERKPWFKAHQNEIFPLYVLEIDTTIAGYATLSPYRNKRPALRFTVEVSYYFDKKFIGQGLGSALLKAMIKTAQQLGFKNMVAILLDNNIPSIKLLKKFKFVEWGNLPEVAEINGKKVGHCYYGRKIN